MKQFSNLKPEIDELLKKFLQEKKQGFGSKETIYAEVVEQIIDLIFRPGAERLRPILVYFGHKLFLKDKTLNTKHQTLNDVLHLSLCTELFHTAALIHDDIMDQSKTRRGGSSVHEYFAQKNNDKDFGINMAILAGDLCLVWADEIFTLSKIDLGLLLKVKKQFDQLREEVIYGQSMDLSKPKTKDQTLKTYEYKTARYTFLRPLLLGAVLADADKKQQEVINKYAISVGIAFQIKDDILDNETQPLGTIKECEDTARNLVNKGKKAILEYNGVLNLKAKQFLLELADYCVERKS